MNNIVYKYFCYYDYGGAYYVVLIDRCNDPTIVVFYSNNYNYFVLPLTSLGAIL